MTADRATQVGNPSGGAGNRGKPAAADWLATDWLADGRFAPLLAELLSAVVKQYRLDEHAASKLLCESLSASPLGEVVLAAATPADVRRTRAYKDAAAAAKRHVYHTLRRYRADDGGCDAAIARLRDGGARLSADELASLVAELLDGHASTRERTSVLEAFNGYLVQACGPAASVVDIGCGVQPLAFPLCALPNLALYAAIDSNRRSIDAVSAYAGATHKTFGGVLRPVCDDLSGGWRRVLAALGLEEDVCFDAALMLKLVPVVARQSPRLLDVLADTPARRWIVTGSTVALAKRASIARRERGVLRRFLDQSGRRIVEEFSFGEEFGFIAEPP